MVSPTLTSLADAVAVLTERITALEEWKAAHEVSMATRQAQIDRLRHENEQMAWAVRNGRQDII